MRYRRWTPAVLALPALLLAACGSSTTPSSAGGNNYGSSMSTKSSTSGMTGKSTGKSKSGSSGMMSSSTASLMKVKTHLGAVLADSKGLTLYWYSKDTSMTSACTGGCATAWPPLTGKPMAAMGVRLTGKLGTITRSGGIVQATYKGHPLYTYAGDASPGQVKGNGLGGVWHVLRVNAISAVSANSLMMGAGSSPSPKARSSMGSGGSGGGGY
jgi:predicted lipoprotein with Yx(FWY)xxD motif